MLFPAVAYSSTLEIWAGINYETADYVKEHIETMTDHRVVIRSFDVNSIRFELLVADPRDNTFPDAIRVPSDFLGLTEYIELATLPKAWVDTQWYSQDRSLIKAGGNIFFSSVVWDKMDSFNALAESVSATYILDQKWKPIYDSKGSLYYFEQSQLLENLKRPQSVYGQGKLFHTEFTETELADNATAGIAFVAPILPYRLIEGSTYTPQGYLVVLMGYNRLNTKVTPFLYQNESVEFNDVDSTDTQSSEQNANLISIIDKQVFSERQHAKELGFTNDEQGDPRFHGGIQKALHIYPSENYPIWKQELGDKAIFQSAGAFGENISSMGITEESICLKDKVRIGSTLLEVSQGRMPCWKFNVRFDQNDMARRLQATLRTGWYFRVLEEGDIGEGDEIVLCERPYPDWSLARIMRAVFTGSQDREELSQMAELPLVESWGKLVERRLETGEVEDWEMRLVGLTAA